MKNTFTKIFAFILAAAVCASFAGCSQSEQKDGAGGNSESVSNSQSVSPGEVDDTAEEDGAGESNEDADGSESASEENEPEESTAPAGEGEEAPAGDDGEASEDDGEAAGDDGEAPENSETAVLVPEGEQIPASDIGKLIAETAISAVGYDFLFGGASPEDGGFDNSGVIYYALTQNGVSCPRQLGDIMAIGTQVDYDGLRAGDPVFFRLDEGSDVVFGGVYVGDGQAVMSFSEGIPVKVVDITSSYYRSNFVYGISVTE